MNALTLLLPLLALLCLAAIVHAGQAGEVDLRDAVVLVPPDLSGPERKAVTMLVEEVEERTQIRWPVDHAVPGERRPVVAVAPAAKTAAVAGELAGEFAVEPEQPGREGFRIRTREADGRKTLFVLGADARGVLFGVGRLLRELRMERGAVRLPGPLQVTTAPRYALRGHQLGYRPKTNSYDAWNLATWEQYFRDLAVFGANAVELIPPRSDDDADSPHFPLPPMGMMVGMSRLADEYGLDVWIWYPAMDPDYTRPETIAFALKEWEEVFRRLPRIDAVFVPGGDPGHTHPRPLMALLEQQAASLRRHHPKAQMWVSPQSFSQEWLDEFLRILREESPAWLAGLVYGPQVRVSLAELRRQVPERYPIRHYPDITHSLRCQYPVPDWDVAYALTEGREPINPRPLGMATIFRQVQPHAAAGFLTYSEGCNDDVNKAVWSALGWDPEADVTEVLREYSRYFLGPRYEESFAQGLLGLERNWQGSLSANEGVASTLQQFQTLERAAVPRERLNWRFQQALYRAYYDAFLRARLLHETALEVRALEGLGKAEAGGVLAALDSAEAILDEARTRPVTGDLRARVFELAEALFQSIRMQLSVPRYQAIAVGRGANLDSIDVPLNNAPWLRRRFAEIRALADEGERRKAIREIVGWTDPGPGGFYDDLGNPARRPHLVTGPGFVEDPAFLRSALTGFTGLTEGRLSWSRHAESLNDAALQLRYPGLDPRAAYRVRVVYGAERTRGRVRLDAGERIQVHDWLEKPLPPRPLAFPLPPGAVTPAGELLLTWRREPGLGGNGRGCQVSEVWLERQ